MGLQLRLQQLEVGLCRLPLRLLGLRLHVTCLAHQVKHGRRQRAGHYGDQHGVEQRGSFGGFQGGGHPRLISVAHGTAQTEAQQYGDDDQCHTAPACGPGHMGVAAEQPAP